MSEEIKSRNNSGVDEGLVAMSIKMSPEERLTANDNAVRAFLELRNAYKQLPVLGETLRQLKTACLLILLLTGCATVTPFEIKNDFLFDQSRFREATAIGICIYNNSIKGLIHVIEFDCMRFAGYEKEIKFYELSKEMMLTPDHLEIQNLNELSGKYPDIKYIFAVFEHNPEIKTKHYKREESEFVNGKEKTVEYEYHETTLEVPCEIMLFEWTSGELIAKAKNSFKETKTDKRAEVFPDHTFFGFLENVVDGMGSGSYPHIESVNPDTARYYFYNFLKHMNNR